MEAQHDCPPDSGGPSSGGGSTADVSPMAITTPYSLEITADQEAKHVVAGTVVTVVAGKLKIFLGSAVVQGKRQQYVGSLRACYRKLMAESTKRGTTGNRVARGNYLSASDGNITIEAVTTNVAATDVAIVKSGSFGTVGNTHMMTESFNQLMNVLLQNTKTN